jgi:hypothetical protein
MPVTLSQSSTSPQRPAEGGVHNRPHPVIILADHMGVRPHERHRQWNIDNA